MFRGNLALSLDPKGRLAIPTRYRDGLQALCSGVLVATVIPWDRCLTVYPAPEWPRIEQELKRLPALDPQVQTIQRLLIGYATECEADAHGRILIPPTLREFAGLDRRVRMVGQVDKFELWDEDRWAAHSSELLERAGSMRQNLSEPLRSLAL